MGSFVLQVVTLIVGFVVPRSVIGYYGSEVNGLIASLTQFVGYFSLVEAGISAAAVYALYEPLVRGDLKKTNIIVSSARKFYYRSGWIFVALIACLAFCYPLLVGCDEVNRMQVAILVVSLGAMGILDFFTLAKYRVLLTATQKNWVIQGATSIYKILYAAIIVFLASLRISVEVVYVCAVFPVIVRTLILTIYTRRKYPLVKFDENTEGYVLDQRWDAFFLQVLGAIQVGAPILIATFLLDDLALVSVFSVYLLVANGVQSICAVVTTGTQASFGDAIARKDMPALRQAYSEMCILMGLLSSAACSASVFLIEPFVSLYIGNIAEISYSYPVLGILLIVNVFFYHLKTPQGLMVVSSGSYRESRPYVMAQTAILLLGAIVGCVYFGLIGIAAGVCLSNLYAAAYLCFFVPDRITKTGRLDTLSKMLTSFTCFIFLCGLGSLIPLDVSSWTGWSVALAALLASGAFGALLFYWIFDRKNTRALFMRFKRVVFNGF